MYLNRQRLINWALRALLIAILVGFAGACGPKYEEMSAQQIYEYGENQFADEDFQDAIEAYEALIDLYPFSVFVTRAELGIADANFMKKRWPEAEAAYESFAKRHPNHEEIDHVIFRIGMCNYEQKLAIDRDQVFTQRAEQRFAEVLSRHPNSRYTTQAQQKLAEVRNELAERERYIARHYWREKEYYASYKRWERINRLFADTEYHEEALYYAARCLFKLDERGEAIRHLELLLEKFPEGDYAGKARSLLSEMQ